MNSIKELEEENCPEDITELVKPQKIHPSHNFNKNNLRIKRSNSVCEKERVSAFPEENYEDLYTPFSKKDINQEDCKVEESKYWDYSRSASQQDSYSDQSDLYQSVPNSGINLGIEIDKISLKYKREWGCPSILIVDDQFINRLILKEFCQQLHLPWAEAEDGKAAVNFMVNQGQKRWCPGILLILMDLNMPRMDGVQATKEILAFKNQGIINPDLSIVAVTAFASTTEEEKCIDAGMEGFIRKPISIFNLWELVKE